jgi:DNA-binding transcriptional ArsR family regulator
MSEVLQLAELGAVLGDPARANMLLALLDGRALPAGELAWQARVAAPTASGHLARLLDAGLVTVLQQGRHRYYRIADQSVARLIEQMVTLGQETAPRRATRVDPTLRAARTCYDHLAGELGVALADGLAQSGHVHIGAEGAEVTAEGRRFLELFGLDLPAREARRFCRICIDWSERRPHLSGLVGVGLCRRCLELGWVERRRDSRAVRVTQAGVAGFQATFGIAVPANAASSGTRLSRNSLAQAAQEKRSA